MEGKQLCGLCSTRLSKREKVIYEKGKIILEDLKRQKQPEYKSSDLEEMYVYMDVVGNTGLARRTLNQELFPEEKEIILHYNPHPKPRARICHLECPKERVEDIKRILKENACIEMLPTKYNPLENSPRNKYLGIRGEKVQGSQILEV